MESHRRRLIAPGLNYDNTCEMSTTSSLEPQFFLKFTQAPLPSIQQNVDSESKAGVEHSSYNLDNNLGTVSHSNQRMVAPFWKS